MNDEDRTSSTDDDDGSPLVDLMKALVLPAIVIVVLLVIHGIEAALGPMRR
jgi:hypothetical protein